MEKVNHILLLIRPLQYIKNTFIFLPLFFSGNILNINLLVNTFIAFVAFSLTASAVYIFNDLKDIEEDRKHPVKKKRPLATGVITSKEALLLMAFFILSGFFIMSFINSECLTTLGVYVFINICYSFFLKHYPIIDISIIALGFILRLLIGSFATDVPLSMWIVIMTFLLALFLALAKRRDDVIHFNNSGIIMRKGISGYNLKFIDGAMVIMASVVIVSYILYTTSLESFREVHNQYLYLTSLFVILGTLRYLQLCFVENNSSSPANIVVKDKFFYS